MAIPELSLAPQPCSLLYGGLSRDPSGYKAHMLIAAFCLCLSLTYSTLDYASMTPFAFQPSEICVWIAPPPLFKKSEPPGIYLSIMYILLICSMESYLRGMSSFPSWTIKSKIFKVKAFQFRFKVYNLYHLFLEAFFSSLSTKHIVQGLSLDLSKSILCFFLSHHIVLLFFSLGIGCAFILS